MSIHRIKATARVSLTLDFDGGSHWGPECTAEQIHDQATSFAVSQLTKLLSLAKQSDIDVSYIGNPDVRFILARVGPMSPAKAT